MSILTKELGVFDKCSLVYFLKVKTFNHFKDQIHIFMWLMNIIELIFYERRDHVFLAKLLIPLG